MTWLALDIGGANLKAADGRGFAAIRPFALWRAPDQLSAELRHLLAASPPSDRVAATMTGELADCYATKSDGVRAIVAALIEAAPQSSLTIYSTAGDFVSPTAASERPIEVAASNWHALAAFAARFSHGQPALLMDVGSTTADVIPIGPAGPSALGRTDSERLLHGELVYTGVERTPVAAIVSRLPWRDAACPVASELFATAGDAHRLLGHLPIEPHNADTADGRPRTLEASHARLARMICADASMFSRNDALRAAESIRDAQTTALAMAAAQVLERMTGPPATIVLSGQGEFLTERALARLSWPGGPPEVVSLNKALGEHISQCGPAHALAVLAEERLGGAWAP